MKSGLLLLGLVCALVGGSATWYLLKRAQPAAPSVPPVAEGPSKPAGATGETPRAEPLSKESPPPPTQPAPPAPVQPAPAKKVEPALRMGEFLPFPNEGASDYEKKYGALDTETLAKALAALQEQVNAEFGGLVEMQIAQGNFTERPFPLPAGEEVKPSEPPQGKGEVRSSEQMAQMPDGTFRQRTTWVTQADQPEFFAHQAEYMWVANALKAKQKKP